MSLENTINRPSVNEFEEFLHGNSDFDSQNSSVNPERYPANAPFIWVDFSYNFQIHFIDSKIAKSFSASVFGMGGALEGIAGGEIHTNNLSRFLAKTVSYHFKGTENTFYINFYDENSNELGSFHYNSFLIFGDGGGVGTWS